MAVYDDTGMLIHDPVEARLFLEDKVVKAAVSRLLDYSFKNINYDWDGLTPAEQWAIGSKDTFQKLVTAMFRWGTR